MKSVLLVFLAVCGILQAHAQPTFQRVIIAGKGNFTIDDPKIFSAGNGGIITSTIWQTPTNARMLQVVKTNAQGVPGLTAMLQYDGENITKVVPTADGGFIVVGTIYISVPSIVAVKVNASGAIGWSKHYEIAANITSADAIVVNNKLIISGSLRVGDDDDIALLAVNAADGSLSNYRTYKNDSATLAVGFSQFIAPAAGGGYYICSPAGTNEMVVKLNSNFDIVWSKQVAIPGMDLSIKGITATAEGGVALAGAAYTDGDFDYNISMLMKLDNAGNISWIKHYRFDDEYLFILNGFYGVVQSDDGGLEAAGTFYQNNTARYISTIVKVDANGNLLWSKRDSTQDYFKGIVKNSGTNIIVGGPNAFYRSRGTVYFISCDGNGNACSNIPGLSCTPVAISSYTASPYHVAALNLTARIAADEYVKTLVDYPSPSEELCMSGAIARQPAVAAAFTAAITPNRVSGGVINLAINSAVSGNAMLVIKGASGNIVRTQRIPLSTGKSVQTIVLPNILTGMYYAQITMGDLQQQLKFYKD